MKHLAIILLLAVRALAAEVTLAWDANPEPDVAGYELSYGTEAGKHTSTAHTAATQHTLPDMIEGETYYFVVRAKNVVGLMSPPSTEIVYTIPRPSPHGWVVKFCDDEQVDGYASDLAIDGDTKTFWHTVWREGQPQKPAPHEIQVDMKSAALVGGFTYLPRQDEYSGSNVKAFDFYLSADGDAWGDPVATGEIPQGKQLTTITFPPQSARYFRFVAKSNHDNTQSASIAELAVIAAAPASPPSAPQSLRVVLEIRIK